MKDKYVGMSCKQCYEWMLWDKEITEDPRQRKVVEELDKF